MKLTYILCGMGLVLGFGSCSSPKSKPVEVPVIPIESGKQMTDEEMSQHFTNDRLVVLKGVMLNRIDRIIDWGDRFVIFDRRGQQAVIFDTTGNCLAQIKRLGKGPGEYVQVGDCTIDNAGNELILCADQPGKLLWFDRDGKFLREKRVSKCLMEIACFDEYLYGIDCSLQGNTVTRIVPSEEETPILPHRSDCPAMLAGKLISTNGRTVWLSRPFDYIVYALNGGTGEFEPRYRLDWGDEGLSETQLTEKLDEDQIRRDQKTYHVTDVGQVGPYLFAKGISFKTGFGQMIDMRTGEVKSLGWTQLFGSPNCRIGGYGLLENQDRRIVHEVSENVLEIWSEGLKSKGESNAVLDSVMAANAEGMNPVLLFQDVI